MLIITAVICRVMFRFGNKPIEEGQRVFKLLWIKDLGTVKPKPWTRMQERGYHWRYAVGWMGNFIFFGVGLWYMSATLTPTPTLAPTLALIPNPNPNPSSHPSPHPSPGLWYLSAALTPTLTPTLAPTLALTPTPTPTLALTLALTLAPTPTLTLTLTTGT